MPKDPVCGIEVQKGSVKSRFNGQDFYFCCPHCKSKFASNPAEFIK